MAERRSELPFFKNRWQRRCFARPSPRRCNGPAEAPRRNHERGIRSGAHGETAPDLVEQLVRLEWL